MAFISFIKPTNIKEALFDEFWYLVMQGELNQFMRNDIRANARTTCHRFIGAKGMN